MPTDQHVETVLAYITPSQIAKALPPNRSGKSVHVATVHKYMLDGAPDPTGGPRIKLRAVRFPAGWRSTWEWVQEFIDALTAAHEGERSEAPAPRPPAARRRAHERAERELAEAGL